MNPNFPSTPAGFRWRPLDREDAVLLRPAWVELDRQAAGPVWRSWAGSLVDVASGGFDPSLLRVLGLFDGAGHLAAWAAETVSRDDGRVSEVLCGVPARWRGRGFGTLCLRAGCVLARERGSRRVRLEAGAPAQALLLRFGADPARVGASGAWRAELSLSPLAGGVLAWRRLLRRLRRTS